MNIWHFTGNLGADCEQRLTPQGEAVTSFSVGVTAGYGDKRETVWARCTLWGRRGEAVAPYLTKGTKVAVAGEVRMRTFDGRDGKQTALEVRVIEVTLCGDAPQRETAHRAPERAQEAREPRRAARDAPGRREPAREPVREPELDDDLPF